MTFFEDLSMQGYETKYTYILDAAKQRKTPVPVVIYEYPSQGWAYQAAVAAKFFDTKSQQTGRDFRYFIYYNNDLITADNLGQYIKKFATGSHLTLPTYLDPEGKLKEAVGSDIALAKQSGVKSAPALFVIGKDGTKTQITDFTQLAGAITKAQKKAGV